MLEVPEQALDGIPLGLGSAMYKDKYTEFSCMYMYSVAVWLFCPQFPLIECDHYLTTLAGTQCIVNCIIAGTIHVRALRTALVR